MSAPRCVFRPRPWVDLKAGAVIAQTTADYVDPYRLTLNGVYENYSGGDPKRHDLGVELDAGFETRFALGSGLGLQLGAQGGVLFPGGALADATGATIKTPFVGIGRLGTPVCSTVRRALSGVHEGTFPQAFEKLRAARPGELARLRDAGLPGRTLGVRAAALAQKNPVVQAF